VIVEVTLDQVTLRSLRAWDARFVLRQAMQSGRAQVQVHLAALLLLAGAAALAASPNPGWCPYYDEGQRFRCDVNRSKSDRSIWTLPSGDMRNVALVGDSLAGQRYNAMRCLLHFSGRLLRGAHTSTLPSWAKAYPAELQGIRVKKPACMEVLSPGYKLSSICLVAAGAGMAGGSRVAEVLTYLRDHRGPLPDAIFVNEGVWFRGSRGDRELDYIKAIKRDVVEDLRARGVNVFWVETMAQHFATPFGTYKGGWYFKGNIRSCVPISDKSWVLTRNAQVNELLQAMNVTVIPALLESIDLHSKHLESKTRHPLLRNAVDCTHFCEPSALMQRIAATALQATS